MIDAYMSGKLVEHKDYEDKKINGLTVGLFIFIMLLAIVLWVWALVILIVRWDRLETWAKVLGLVFLLLGFGGPIGTLIVVYIDSANK